MIIKVFPSHQDWFEFLVANFATEQLDAVLAFFEGSREERICDVTEPVALGILSAPEDVWTS